MRNYFTKDIIQAGKVIVLGLALGLGVSVVSANWTAPSQPAPGCPAGQPGCDAPINVSQTFQRKDAPNDTHWTLDVLGRLTADRVSAFKEFNAGSLSLPLLNGKANVYGQLTVDRSTQTGSDGRNLLNLIGGGSQNDSVGIVQNKPWFFLWDYSTGGGRRASLRADRGDFDGQVNIGAGIDPQDQDPLLQVNRAGSVGFVIDPGYTSSELVRATLNGKLAINDGTAGPNKVFTSTDSSGLGQWSTLGSGGLDLATVKVSCPWGASSANCAQIDWAGTATGFLSMQARAWCPSGYVPISGGGDCEHSVGPQDPGFRSQPIGPNSQAMGAGTYYYNTSTSSNGQPVGWEQVCPRGDSHVQVICAKSAPVVVSTSTAGGTGGATTTSTWQWLAASSGSVGQTCSAWLTSSQPTATETKAFVDLNNLNPIPASASASGYTGDCAYEYDTEPTSANGAHSKCTTGPKGTSIAGARPVAYCSDPTSQFVMGNAISGMVTYETKTAVLKP